MASLRLIIVLCAAAHTCSHAKRVAKRASVGDATTLNGMAREHASAEASSSTMGSRGINDYPRADEFPEPWTRRENLEKKVGVMNKRVKEIKEAITAGNEHAPLTDEEKKEFMETMWLAMNQELLDRTKMQCSDLCAMCLPDPKELEEKGDEVQLKSIFIKRRKGFWDVARMPIVGPIDFVAGHVAEALPGVVLGLGSGFVAGGLWVHYNMTKAFNQLGPGADEAAGYILGALAGLSEVTFTSAAVMTVIAAFLPLFGPKRGVGITGALTQCSAVGFEAFVNDESDEEHSFKNVRGTYGLQRLRKAMNYNKSWFETEHTHIINLPSSIEAQAKEGQLGPSVSNFRDFDTAQAAGNYNAVSHCEYMRMRKFDVRHVAECMKHSMLCGGRGALLLPANDRGSCQDKSSTAKLEEAAKAGEGDAVFDMWKLLKARAACVKLLCKYEGFENGAKATDPNRTVAGTDLSADFQKEKEALATDFASMKDCTSRFKSPNGEALTLNSAEERLQFC